VLKITGTFLDEITYDIPSQNWGRKEWEKDFADMKKAGIDTAILIRCGHKRWSTYPSKILEERMDAFRPPIDLVDLFLDLADEHGIDFFFGTYDSGKYWLEEKHEKEIELSIAAAEEAYNRYGSSPAFKGWYISLEIGRHSVPIVELFRKLGGHLKDISGDLPVLLSPYIEGRKAIWVHDPTIDRGDSITPEQHEKEWNDIMSGISGSVDYVAFQDGHVDFHELQEFLEINKTLADKYNLESWTNTESFDRDMPIKFLPISWEKLKLKLDAAERAGIEKAITFEWSHFMSPNSCYLQARGLYRLYAQEAGIIS
jgi:hypothetical protein